MTSQQDLEGIIDRAVSGVRMMVQLGVGETEPPAHIILADKVLDWHTTQLEAMLDRIDKAKLHAELGEYPLARLLAMEKEMEAIRKELKGGE